ncbi:MAG: NifB/NifX family molybdenum-iron cluster-binding protein [Lacibacter sp.]
MKIAVPVNDGKIEEHFGMCKGYLVFSSENSVVHDAVEYISASAVCGCKSNIAAILQQKQVTVMLAGNMGNGALNVLVNHGIAVYRGLSGDARKCVTDYVNNRVIDSGVSCQHHGEINNCTNH